MATWPPPSLEVNAEAIVNECELAEITPVERPMLAPVHMAALLYLGETVHARHLWRRTSDRDQLLQDWWEVGKAMIQGDDPAVPLQQCSQHPEPLKTYASEVKSAMASSIAPKSSQQLQHGSELRQLDQQVVSFLETKQWNA